MRRIFGSIVSRISSRALLIVAIGVSSAVAIGLAGFLLANAKRAEAQFVQTVEARLLRVLEAEGLSGISVLLDRTNSSLVPGQDQIEIAVWRSLVGNLRLHRETREGVGLAFGSNVDQVEFNGQRYRVRKVDIAKASADWSLPMNDVALSFGLTLPSSAVSQARRTILAIGSVYAVALLAILLLSVGHWQQYRRGISQINRSLDLYSNGETGILVDAQSPAPELVDLVRHLNTVLPKIDRLFADLRAVSGHLAHELKNPLQAIRSDVHFLADETDDMVRRQAAGQINKTIDLADARLLTVMQLFRLQADAEIEFTNIDLGCLVEDHVYDYEDALTTRNRTLTTQITNGIKIVGNQHLLELLMINLLSNSIKYTDESGAVSVSLHCNDKEFSLRVENSAILQADVADHVFSRYAQGRRHAGISGAGLGLSLVQTIASRHGFEASMTQQQSDDGTPVVRAQITGQVAPSHAV